MPFSTSPHKNGSIQRRDVSEFLGCRFVSQLTSQEKTSPGRDMWRYEHPHINEIRCGDSSAGPYLKTDDTKDTGINYYPY